MQSIDITTTQNVTIEYELAGLRERFLAQLVDIFVMIFIFTGIKMILPDSIFFGSRFFSMLFGLFPFWFTIIYHIACEAFLNGQSLGKRLMGIKVVRLDGKPTSLSDLLLRAVLLLSEVFTLGVLGTLLISTTDKKQRLGDMAAGTSVIKIGTNRRFKLDDILNIDTLENYTPQYPQVKKLNEEDMLFIKNVIIRYQRYKNGSHSEAVDKLYAQLKKLLEIPSDLYYTSDKIDFLKTLIKDYIVLTR